MKQNYGVMFQKVFMRKKGEMRLRDPVSGERLYLNKGERERFLACTVEEKREYRVLCHVLHYTGCRITEALELTTDSIHIDDCAIVFRTLKQRKEKKRVVDIPQRLIEDLDLVFNLRHLQKTKAVPALLWSVKRVTGWRVVKRVMERAEITGKQAVKGLGMGLVWQ